MPTIWCSLDGAWWRLDYGQSFAYVTIIVKMILLIVGSIQDAPKSKPPRKNSIYISGRV